MEIRLTAQGAGTLVELFEDAVSGPGRFVPEPAEGRVDQGAQRRDPAAAGPAGRGTHAPVSHDAIVVGAGPNGLVAANHLLDKGWSVLVLEARARGRRCGAQRRGRRARLRARHVQRVLPAGRRLAVDPVLRPRAARPALAPRARGAGPPDARRPLGAAAPGPGRHRRSLDRDHPGDGAAWLELCAQWDRIGEHLVHALVSPFPPVRSGLATLARLRSVGGLDFVKTLLTPAADLGAGAVRRHRARGCCWPATPGTPTSRSTRPAPGCWAC